MPIVLLKVGFSILLTGLMLPTGLSQVRMWTAGPVGFGEFPRGILVSFSRHMI